VPLDSRWATKPTSGQLTVTIGKFYRVTGESTQLRGVEPDVPLPSPIDLEEVGESALPAALPWDRIPGVPFHSEERAAPAAAALTLEESARAQRDPDYRWLVSDIAALDSLRKQKSVSLNLKNRREERARQEKERLDRENARRSAKGEAPLKAIGDQDATTNGPDIVLEQAAEVMGDIVSGARPGSAVPMPKRQVVDAVR
jgi:carboxyl-terminal processing protease